MRAYGGIKGWVVALLAICSAATAFAQGPFVCNGDAYISLKEQNESSSTIFRISIDPITSIASFESLSTGNAGFNTNAIGFRSSDNYIYGLVNAQADLLRIGNDGKAQMIGTINGLSLNNRAYFGAAISPDGRYFTLASFHFDDGSTRFIVLVDLESPTFEFIEIPVVTGSPISVTDIAYHPTNGLLYGFDEKSDRLVEIDPTTGQVNFSNYPFYSGADAMGACFFDPFGNFYGYGNTQSSGTSINLFQASIEDGIFSNIAQGPPASSKDACSCPYTVEILKTVNPETAFPCTNVSYTFSFINGSSDALPGITFEDQLPAGITFVQTLSNPFGSQNISSVGGTDLLIADFTLPPGQSDLIIEVYIEEDNIGIHSNQAILSGLPEFLGDEIISDNPSTAIQDDPTLLEVLPLFVDLGLDTLLICNQDSVFLTATNNGLEYLWHDGSTDSEFLATSPGIYSVTVNTGCELATDSIWIIEDDLNVLDGGVVEIELGLDAVLYPEIITNFDYQIQWQDPMYASLSCLDCLNPTASPVANTIYYFTASSSGGCMQDGQIEVRVNIDRGIYVPNVFSPNGDGNNDEFIIQSVQNMQINSIAVFDRWGDLVARQSNLPLGNYFNIWNGKFKGKKMNPGVFVWIAEVAFLDGELKQLEGELTLLR